LEFINMYIKINSNDLWLPEVYVTPLKGGLVTC